MNSQEVIENFYTQNKSFTFKYPTVPTNISDIDKYTWLIGESHIPYWEVMLKQLPYKEMLNEAIRLFPKFVDHRNNDPTLKGNAHSNWSSLTIHGISSQHTMNWDSYPEYKQLRSEEKVPYNWTEISKLIPTTVEYFRDIFPNEYYTRVRFMRLKPRGFILPHRDRDHKLLFPINIALNNPEGCEFIMENYGIVPFKESKSFLLDLSNRHAVWNNSNEDRVHIIVHWRTPPLHTEKGQEWMEQVFEALNNDFNS